MEGRDALDGEVQSRQHNTTGRGCTVGRVNGGWTVDGDAMAACVGRQGDARAPPDLQTLALVRPSLWTPRHKTRAERPHGIPRAATEGRDVT